MTLTKNDKEISEHEALLYDRQIRLWGVNAQKSLRKANVLLVGLCGSGSEITKNLILSGVNSITIIENQNVVETDAFSNLFTRNQIGQNRAKISEQNLKNLNPIVNIEIKEWDIKELINQKDDRLISLLQFVNVICINNFDSITISKFNNLIREFKGNDTKFYATCNWGYYAFSFTDLGSDFRYHIEEIEKSHIDLCNENSRKRFKTDTKDKQKKYVEKLLSFVVFENMIQIKGGKGPYCLNKKINPTFILVHVMFEFYKKFNRYPNNLNRTKDQQELANLAIEVTNKLQTDNKILDKLNEQDCWNNVFGELSPITAILGGVVGQDIVRSITRQDPPIKNVFLFNGFQCSGSIESIGK